MKRPLHQNEIQCILTAISITICQQRKKIKMDVILYTFEIGNLHCKFEVDLYDR